MKNIAVIIYFILWVLVTLILTATIIGIIVLAMMSEDDWFDIPNKLIDKMN